MNRDTAIRVENLGKRYQLGGQKSGSFRESLSSLFRRGTENGGRKTGNGKNDPSSVLPSPSPVLPSSDFWALQDINFEIKRGEAVGIIGRNGAGKSTLLKILSRITEPTKGRFEIFGRVSSLLEVGTGFHPELTGRENVYLNGTILGMKRREVKTKFDEIVAFSGVEKFIDTPVKHYSSGMQVRLAFAVAAHLEPEILIIDEVLAVGDAEFQRKCLGKMEDVAGQGRTVLFVSHNMAHVEALCNCGILLSSGTITFKGSITEAVSHYLMGAEFNQNIDLERLPRVGIRNDGLTLLRARIITGERKILEGESVELEITFKVTMDIDELVLGFSLSDHHATLVESRSSADYKTLNVKKGNIYKACVKVTPQLVAGMYNLNIGARCPQGNLEYIPSVTKIEILREHKLDYEHWNHPVSGKVLINQNWSITAN